MTLGSRLYEMRKDKGLSQEQTAEILGVTRQTVSKWETDQSTPDFDKIMPLCELYNITPDELLTGSKQKEEAAHTYYSQYYDNDNNNNINSNEQQNNEDIKHYNKYKTKSALLISIAIFLYIMSVIPFFVVHNSTLMFSLFFIIIAIATMLIVFAAVSKPKGLNNTAATKEQKLYKQITNILSGIVLIIYMLISFSTGAWHITWLIWIIYAIVCRIIKLIFELKGAEINDENE